MAKKIDMGEPVQSCAPPALRKGKAPKKWYPSLSVPESLGQDTVGKSIQLLVQGRVTGLREERRDGQPTRRTTEIEVRSVTVGKAGGGKGTNSSGGGYVAPWMREVGPK